MAPSIWGNGSAIIIMEMASISIQMAKGLRDSLVKVKKQGSERCTIPMETTTKEIGMPI